METGYKKESDNEFILKAYSEYETRKYFLYSGTPVLGKDDYWNCTLIARGVDEPKGFVRFEHKSRGNEIEIKQVYVVDDFRNKGLGKGLIEMAIEKAKNSWRFERVIAITVENKAGEKIFESCGFKNMGTHEKSGYFDGKFYNQTLWIKTV